MSTRTVSITDLRVGDRVVSLWGTTFTRPLVVTSVDVSPSFGGGVVRAGMAVWPVRRNDLRPVEVQS